MQYFLAHLRDLVDVRSVRRKHELAADVVKQWRLLFRAFKLNPKAWDARNAGLELSLEAVATAAEVLFVWRVTGVLAPAVAETATSTTTEIWLQALANLFAVVEAGVNGDSKSTLARVAGGHSDQLLKCCILRIHRVARFAQTGT